MTLAFFRDIVSPALVALDAQIAECQSSDDPISEFIQADAEQLLQATTMAFCLSIQSLWERQIRGYLQGCAKELQCDEALMRKATTGKWIEMDSVFRTLRNISLTEFEQYPQLDFLHVLGNACRHGNGPSLQALWKRHPELWPNRAEEALPSILDEDIALPPWQSTIEALVIPRDYLERFVTAIVSFWSETEYIYNESIERKHPNLEARLVVERRERASRGKR